MAILLRWVGRITIIYIWYDINVIQGILNLIFGEFFTLGSPLRMFGVNLLAQSGKF